MKEEEHAPKGAPLSNDLETQTTPQEPTPHTAAFARKWEGKPKAAPRYDEAHIADRLPVEHYKNDELIKQVKYFVESMEGKFGKRHALNIALKQIKNDEWEKPQGYDDSAAFEREGMRKYQDKEKLRLDALAALQADGLVEPAWNGDDSASFDAVVAFNAALSHKMQQLEH